MSAFFIAWHMQRDAGPPRHPSGAGLRGFPDESDPDSTALDSCVVAPGKPQDAAYAHLRGMAHLYTRHPGEVGGDVPRWVICVQPLIAPCLYGVSRRRWRRAGGDCRVPSAPRPLAAAARSKAQRGNARPGQAAQDRLGWSFWGLLAPGPPDGPSGEDRGGNSALIGDHRQGVTFMR
jgi:hypothetical protein